MGILKGKDKYNSVQPVASMYGFNVINLTNHATLAAIDWSLVEPFFNKHLPFKQSGGGE